MKRRIGTVVLLLVVLLGVSMTARASAPRMITGGVDFEMVLYTGEMAMTHAMYQIRELDPITHEARGTYQWWTKTDMKDRLVVDVDCVIFSEDGTAATFSGRPTLMQNWEEYLRADYFLVHLVDGGTPGSAGDQHGFTVGDMGIGFSCDPCRDAGCLERAVVTFMLPVSRGNLTIH
jgi:hypothetical protein